MINIAIFASGAGTNAEKIIGPLRSPEGGEEKTKSFNVALIVCNKPGAGVLKIAERNNIPTLMIEKGKFNKDGYLDHLIKHKIEFIVLAGFLWKLPTALIDNFPRRIINIHPALLPNYGGKGMYGERVHQAVIDNKEKESGITIHYVDAFYDHGDIILQVKCPVFETDTPQTLAERVHALEHANYPTVIERLADKLKS